MSAMEFSFLSYPLAFSLILRLTGVVLVYYPVSLHTAISRKVVGRKAPKCTGQDPNVVWVVTGIFHIGLEEMNKFVFLHVDNLFFLWRLLSVALLFCRMSLS